jgi:hypothetical protein
VFGLCTHDRCAAARSTEYISYRGIYFFRAHRSRDAPALSIDNDPAVSGLSNAVTFAEISNGAPKVPESEQWDDEALAAATLSRKAASSTGTSEVLEMKSLDTQRKDQGNIAEKLRVEETKAQLAAAREGMEREGAKRKEEREKKDEEKPRFVAAAATSVGGGSKWLPSRMRSGGGASLTRMRMGGPGQKLDVQDEELFPDLATADKILEQKERDQQPVLKAPKKTPVGGRASWASKPKTPPPKDELAEAVEEVPVEEAPIEEPPKSESEGPNADSSTGASPAKTVVKKTTTTTTKKKKKDLSTFKPGAS